MTKKETKKIIIHSKEIFKICQKHDTCDHCPLNIGTYCNVADWEQILLKECKHCKGTGKVKL